MSFKKSISVLMVVSQMGWVSMASAAAPTTATPEFKMLQGVLALQGQNLSSDQTQKQVSSFVTNYLSTAPQTGQQERLQAALVDLGVYDAAQAAAFVADSQKAARTAEMSGSAASSTMMTEINHLASVHPMGAQFSSCELGSQDVSGSVALAGVLVLTVGAVLRWDNPTCSAPVIGETFYSNGQTATTYGPTTCTQANYYPHAAAGDDTMIAGGVMALVGGLLFLMDAGNGC